MSKQQIRVGQTYYTGNSFNPEAREVTHLVGFADLSEGDQRTWTESYAAHLESPAGRTFVWYRSKRKHDVAWTPNLMLPEDVFKATVYESLDAFYAARAAAPGPAGLLRCTLPGEASREGLR